MTSYEFAEWQAYARLEPFGQQRKDKQLAKVAAELSNRWRGKNERPRNVNDFVESRERPRIQTLEEQQAILKQVLPYGTSSTP